MEKYINLIFFLISFLTAILLKSVQWGVLTLVYLLLTLFVIKFSSTEWRPRIYLVTSIYLLLEVVIKLLINFNVISYSWFFLNRMEHGLWALFFTLTIYPLVSKIESSSFIKILIVFLLGNFVGILNEQFEFLLREYYNLTNTLYYSDTIIDLTMNMIGTSVASLLIYFRYRK